MKRRTVLSAGLLVLTLVAGCRKAESSGGGGHSHQAPHGGKLIELGDHVASIELVRDTTAGKLTAYVLDGHAENFIRISASELTVTLYSGGERRTLPLKAVANAGTGETVGNTSQFEGQADWLKKGGELNGELSGIEIRGTKFPNAAFQLK